ncbi:single-stranded-DNA-specific exonuclease RecJ [Marinilabiliaceae bacterium ANBcel2]|nr:single-stranded-DNA-specific exonuclease RecJ [Marinilabiliaceae bacterium ANBcel2]
MKKEWIIKKDELNHATVEKLSEEINIDKILAQLLVERNILNSDSANSFFDPSLDKLHDPFLMKDMDKAIERISRAFNNGEKIMIYGDYDVDGTTSVAMVYAFLRKYYANMEYYIPNRYKEGYGISSEGVEYAADAGCHLIISLDCGIKAEKKVALAKKMGIEFIICDHHTPGETLPDAVACLDPKQPGCNYPEKNLSGCGVGFKLLQAFCIRKGEPQEPLFKYLDLVAVSIAADIVPVTGENRIMAKHGIERLNKNPGTGLKSIIDIAKLNDRQILISDIIFKIGPRINAAGRIESGRDAVELLISRDPSIAKEMSIAIDQFNKTRKELDKKTTQEALKMIEEKKELQQKKSTVLYKNDWHKGVIAIVAARLTDSYYRPTVILTKSNGLITGSARSVEGFDVYKAIEACSHLLENFGGHMYAAGLTMKRENISQFEIEFEEYVRKNIKSEQLIPQIEIDAELNLKHINKKFYNTLKKFMPFGPGNKKPVFVTRNVQDFGTSKLVGKNKNHIKMELIGEDSGSIVQAIGFSMGKYINRIKNGEQFDICYTIEENYINGISSIQLVIIDTKFPC